MSFVSTQLRWAASLGRPYQVVIAAFVSADLVLIAAYCALKLGWLADPNFHIGDDAVYGELLQYAKLFWVGLGMAWLAWRTSEPICGVLAVLFWGLLLDDGAMLHERWGAAVAGWLSLPSVGGLEGAHVGEIVFLASWVGPLFLIGVGAYRRAGPWARGFGLRMLAVLAVLAGFGVGVDAVHQLVVGAVEVPGLHSLFVLVEEGGEMLVLSVILAIVADRVLAGVPETAVARERRDVTAAAA